MSIKRVIQQGLMAVGLLAIIVSFTPLVEFMTKPLALSQEVNARQTAVVLSSGIYQSGLPDFQTMTRMVKGLELYKSGKVRTILCLGGQETGAGESYARCMAELYGEWGVPEHALSLYEAGGHTAIDLESLFNEKPSGFSPQDAVYVTSAYHTLRLRLLLDKRGVEAPVVSAWPTELYPESWAERLLNFKCVVREYGVLAVSKLLGWI